MKPLDTPPYSAGESEVHPKGRFGMRKLVVGVVIALAVGSGTSEADAQSPPRTTWWFHQTYESGQYAESHDPTESHAILMYTGSTWQCTRVPVSLSKTGNLTAGYRCMNQSGAWTTVVAACNASKPDDDMARAGIGDANGYVRVMVTCSTKAVTPTKAPAVAPGPIEKSL